MISDNKPKQIQKHTPYKKELNITPTWSSMIDLLLILYKDGQSSESRSTATTELKKMAQLADLWVAHKKDNPSEK